MRIFVKDIKNFGGFDSTSRNEYQITLCTQNDKNISREFVFTYLDYGNNAEYEPYIYPRFNYDILEDADFEMALNEFIDRSVYNNEVGIWYEYDPIDLKMVPTNVYLLAYCPIEIDFEQALKTAINILKPNYVTIITKGYGAELFNIKIAPLKGLNANEYGSDLYLYEVNKNGKGKYISCGDFK